MTSASALGIPGLGQTLVAGTRPPVLLSPPARSPSCPQGQLRPSLSFGLAPAPPWQGRRGGPARVSAPWLTLTGKDSLSWEGSSPGLQLLLLGGAGPLSALSAQGSAPLGVTTQDPLVPLKLSPPPVPPPQRPEKMSQVLGKWGSSWGPGPLDPKCFGQEVCLLEDSLPFPPILVPTLLPAFSLTHPVLLKGALRTHFL